MLIKSLQEPALYSRLLDFAKDMTPVNKAYIFEFFFGACPQMGRVKRWLAHGLLLSADSLKPVCLHNAATTIRAHTFFL